MITERLKRQGRIFANLVASDAFWKEPEYAVLRDELLKSGVMDGEKLS